MICWSIPAGEFLGRSCNSIAISLHCSKVWVSNIVRLSNEVVLSNTSTLEGIISSFVLDKYAFAVWVAPLISESIQCSLSNISWDTFVSDELTLKVSDALDSDELTLKVWDELDSDELTLKVWDELDSDEVKLIGFEAINDVS